MGTGYMNKYLIKEIGRNWFTDKVVDEWNRVSSRVVNINTIESFPRLRRFMVNDE